jgi:hypothetical protein
LELWNLQSQTKVHSILFSKQQTLLFFGFTPNTSNFITIADFELTVRNVNQLDLPRRSTIDDYVGGNSDILFIPRKREVLLGLDAGKLRLLDLMTGKVVREFCS